MIEMEGMYDEDIKIRSNNKQWRKLVDYYNQMREEKFGEKGYFEYTMRFDNVHIISKHMGFIDRLVKNKKIDLGACEGEKTYNNLTVSRDSNYTQYERLLMALSIQDNPITVLLSILK